MLSRILKLLERTPRRLSRRPDRTRPESLESRQLLSAVTVQLAAAQDTTIYEAGNDLSNGAGEFILAGGGTRGLVQFDLNAAQIPDGATVIDAVLTLNVATSSGSTAGVSVHRVTTSWGEGNSNAEGDETAGAAARPFDATWQFASFGGTQWQQEGGDILGASSSTTVGATGTYEWFGGGLIDDAQQWLDDAATNFGWLLNLDGPALKSFVSKDGPDAALAPTLELTYETPPEPPAFVEGRLWNDLNGDGIQTDLLIAQLQLGIVNNNTHFNGFGGREHWFRSEVNNQWYYLTENGTLTKWAVIQGALAGEVVGTVDPKFYLQPSLVETSRGNPEPYLDGWTVELLNEHGSVIQTTTTAGRDTNGDGAINVVTEGGWYRFQVLDDPTNYTVRQVVPEGWKQSVEIRYETSSGGQQGVGALDLRFHRSWFENAGGLGEKWLREPTKGWYYITPDGVLRRWNGKPFSSENPLTGEQIGTPGPEYFDNPHLLAGFNPNPPDEAPQSSHRTDFGNTRSLIVKGRVWLDFFDNGVRDLHVEGRELLPTDTIGTGEAWFFDAPNDAWYIINVAGHARYWGQHSDIDVSELPNIDVNEIPFQSSEPWINGRTVELIGADGNVVATTVTQSIDLNDDGTIQYETERGWYLFEGVPEGEYRLRTVTGNGWTQTAPIGGTHTLAAELDEQLGLRTTGSDFRNWGGMNERWVIGEKNGNRTWYYILADGSFYQWDVGSGRNNGGLRGTKLAQLTPDHYLNLRLLTNPDLSAISIAVSNNTATPDILFGNHRLLGELL